MGFFEYKEHEGIGHHTWSSTTMCDLSTPPLALHQSCSPLHPQLSLWPPVLLPLLPHCGDKDKQIAAIVQHVLGSCLYHSAPSWQGSPHSSGEAVKVSSHVTASPYCCADCSSLGHAPFTCCDFTLWTFQAPGWQVRVLPFSSSDPPGSCLHNLPKPQTLTTASGIRLKRLSLNINKMLCGAPGSQGWAQYSAIGLHQFGKTCFSVASGIYNKVSFSNV